MSKEEIFKILYNKEKWEVYREFQKIENSIDESNELYKYYDEIKNMLLNEKSFIRVRAFRIICRLSKYDNENKINKDIDLLLNVFDNDKPTIVRQCFVAIQFLLLYKPELSNKIKDKIKKINCFKYKDSMSPLIKKDIDNTLEKINLLS